MPTEPKTNLIGSPPTGPGMHALVIGVSQYKHLEGGTEPTDRGDRSRLKQLSSAARSAGKFAEWLLVKADSAESPLCSLRIALSPSDGEEIPRAVSDLIHGDHSATRKQVEAALGEFIADCKTDVHNIAVVYVAGHGVQITKQGATVLLSDYGDEDHLRELDGAIDVISVHRGMNGTGFPSRQFWFVDACRQKPRVAGRFETLRGGIGLDEPKGAVDSTPIYLATVTGESAYGEPGGESLFCQALLWSLEEWGAAVPPGVLSNAWHVSVTSLAVALPQRVRTIADAFAAEQSVEVAGKPNEALFHAFPNPPEVDVEIDLRPPAALPCNRTVQDRNFDVVPLSNDAWPLRTKLVAGLYSIKVEPSAPFKPDQHMFQVLPPSYTDGIEVES